MEVRKITKADWSEVREIYQLGIDTGVATFETSPPIEFETWLNKIDKENGICLHQRLGNSGLGDINQSFIQMCL